MLIVTLGTQASGSTWLFNVVLALFKATDRSVFSLSCDQGAEALDTMPLGVGDVVMKSHAMDQRLLRIAKLAGAKLIVSTRDPRDSVVSQHERFGASLQHASSELSRAFATIGSLPCDLPALGFAYEDRFMERRKTIASIADYLDIAVNDAAIDDIFVSLLPENVRARIEARLGTLPDDEVPCHDPVTHWHPKHIGDGRSGKWRDHLDSQSLDVVNGCLCPLASPGLWCHEPLRWSAELFTSNAGPLDAPTIELTCTGMADYLLYGPYLHIPRGRWRAVPSIRVTTARSCEIEADIFLPWDDRRVAHRCTRISRATTADLMLDFDHHDHFQPVEARLLSVEGETGSIVFSGWNLYWRGPLE